MPQLTSWRHLVTRTSGGWHRLTGVRLTSPRMLAHSKSSEGDAEMARVNSWQPKMKIKHEIKGMATDNALKETYQPVKCTNLYVAKNPDRVNPMLRDDLDDCLYQLLKDRVTGRVSLVKLYKLIRSFGVLDTDPRLLHLNHNIQALQKVSMEQSVNQAIDPTDQAYHLDEQTFKKCIKGCAKLLVRVMTNNLVVADWPAFQKLVDKLHISCLKNETGKVSTAVSTLARADPTRWGVAACSVDGQRYSRGDTEMAVCLHAAQFPLAYSLAVNDTSEDHIHKYVGRELSGLPHTTLGLNSENIPHNPMVNSGAMVITSLIQKGKNAADRFDYILEHYRKMTGGEPVNFSNATFLSERESSHNNMAIGYVLKERGCFPENSNFQDVMDLYFQLCSIEMSCQAASVAAATLANGGICPITGRRVLSASAVRNTLSLMLSCGMYAYSGQFAFKVGLPAKSSISGLVLLVVPDIMGIALYSPALDSFGNSCRGIQFCEDLVKNVNYHNYDSLIYSRQTGDVRYKPYTKLAHDIVTTNFSAYQNDITALRRVYMRGVNMNQADYDNRTALHVAAAEGHLEIVRFLLEVAGVDPNPKDRWNFTPRAEAARFNHDSVKEYLDSYLYNFGYESEADHRNEMSR